MINPLINRPSKPFPEGVSFTDSEIGHWKYRWNNTSGLGKYLTTGDRTGSTGQTFSPDDKTRILARANSLVSDITLDFWTRPTTYYPTGPTNPSAVIPMAYVPQWVIPDPVTEGQYTLAAAFTYRMTGTASYLTAAKQSIFDNFARYSFLDFSNSTIWQSRVLRDINPGFIIAQMINKFFCAYDLIKKEFTDAERLEIDTRFAVAAEWFREDIDYDIGTRFIDRPNGNYTIQGAYNGASSLLTHDSGEVIPFISMFYNNRRSDIFKMIHYIGIHLYNRGRETGNSSFVSQGNILRNSGRLFVKEAMRFSFFPSGLDGELERNLNDPQKGMYYWGLKLNNHLEMAYIDSLNGNDELFNYSTSLGWLATTDGSTTKSLTKSLDRFLKQYTGEYVTFNTVGGVPYQMNGLTPSVNERLIQDCTTALWAYKWYRAIGNTDFADKLEQQYKRTRPGVWAFPSNPSSNGANVAVTGPGGNNAGLYFQLAEFDNINPFI